MPQHQDGSPATASPITLVHFEVRVDGTTVEDAGNPIDCNSFVNFTPPEGSNFLAGPQITGKTITVIDPTENIRARNGQRGIAWFNPQRRRYEIIAMLRRQIEQVQFTSDFTGTGTRYATFIVVDDSSNEIPGSEGGFDEKAYDPLGIVESIVGEEIDERDGKVEWSDRNGRWEIYLVRCE